MYLAMARWNTQDLKAYRTTLLQRQIAGQVRQAERLTKAGEVAKQAAALLKTKFGAERVMLFGSVVHGYWFSATSDIDLAVWGLDALAYLTAVAQLQDLAPEFKIDLVRMERCEPELERAILAEGQLL
ncbi:MAG: nucleotidyltransferase domain-containing protein [Pegethrix bostrychoides GSE-TBD4-15B]|uniref:Nucleotidyltransferase domain-containing protein n=1 Tax=Pegethrix bostrychoides GSE-TBD4-15B TaxID=2839662 RepID=A0A951U4S2_9CYAN|nr:nucleotidyltransferase domain-containing protein [Pegethrix bostrychoides GSE-TBD4-15B]